MSRAPGTAARSAVVVLAGGSGTRVGAPVNKVLLPLGDAPVLVHSVRTVLELEDVHRVVLVVRSEDRDAVADAVAPHLGRHDVWLVDGGAERHDSEWAALKVLADDVDGGEIEVVAIHDAARPLATAGLFRRVVAIAQATGAAVPVVAAGALSRSDGSLVGTPLAGVQTPQAFRAQPLLASYRSAAADGFRGTDTASCWERYGGDPVAAVAGSPTNLKVTFPEDVALLESLLAVSGSGRG